MTVAAGVSRNNRTTAVPFSIPEGMDSISILASGADCYAELKIQADGVTSLATTAALGKSIGTSEYQIPLPTTKSSKAVLAIFNNNIASRTVDVWANYA
jgi:hypothetical protein